MNITKKIEERKGHTVVSYCGTTRVVLVEKESPLFDRSEWVTWVYDNRGETYWGHYFQNKEEAVEDFNMRVKDEMLAQGYTPFQGFKTSL